MPTTGSLAPVPAVDADDELAGRDPRQSTSRPRPRALLVTEVQGLESLLHATAEASRDRPQLLRRLAEDYVELEHASPSSDDATAAQQAAIAMYLELATAYPDDSQLDEVLYFLAYEYERANDFRDARKAYFDLIVKRPNSKYIPNAYLAFGELFFADASRDPSKWELAKQAYMKVISYPPPDDKVYGFAWYRLAHVYLNLGEQDHARQALEKTVDYAVTYPQIPSAAKLGELARKDMHGLGATVSSSGSAR